MNGSTFTAATPAGTFTVESRLWANTTCTTYSARSVWRFTGGATCDQVR